MQSTTIPKKIRSYLVSSDTIEEFQKKVNESTSLTSEMRTFVCLMVEADGHFYFNGED
jgi:hypothetical protein